MKKDRVVLDIIEQESYYDLNLSTAFQKAEEELFELQETIDSVKNLQPDCDKMDYALAASCGALCGVLDVFLIGKPGESPLGDITDKWFADRTCDFAKLCGWKGNEKNPVASAIGFLERKYKVPYDQRSVGDAATDVFDFTPKNHHFKSLAHNPTLMGLFFSILDQFTEASHIVSGGLLIDLGNGNEKFVLQENSIPAKILCGFVNWFGHLMSDCAGSSHSAGQWRRGMGLPAPLWTWVNDITAIKAKLGIPVFEFEKNFNELAVEVYKQGNDVRFQTAQAIPVLINELLVRFIYSIRRLIRYYAEVPADTRNFKKMWEACKPFSKPTIRRMLTIAHGTFCLVDIGDATIRGVIAGGGSFNPLEFILRINLVGVGRFAVSLYGEVKAGAEYRDALDNAELAERKKQIINNYKQGLRELSDRYDDKDIFRAIDDLDTSGQDRFEQSLELTKLRGVPDYLPDKTNIDNYFNPQKDE